MPQENRADVGAVQVLARRPEYRSGESSPVRLAVWSPVASGQGWLVMDFVEGSRWALPRPRASRPATYFGTSRCYVLHTVVLSGELVAKASSIEAREVREMLDALQWQKLRHITWRGLRGNPHSPPRPVCVRHHNTLERLGDQRYLH